MTQSQEPIEFLVMPKPGVGIDKLRQILEGHVQDLRFVKLSGFSTVVYSAAPEVYKKLKSDYQKQFGEIIAAMDTTKFTPGIW